MKFSGDFRSVAKWARRNRSSWAEFIKGIIQKIEEFNLTYNSITNFITIYLIIGNKSLPNFLKRLKKHFYAMLKHKRIIYQIRNTLINKLRNHTPSVWDALES
jgi:hypothetical protein